MKTLKFLILKSLFLSASATDLVKSLSTDAGMYCFIILYNFTFVLHFCVRVERVYFNKVKVDGRIILRWTFRKREGVVGTGWSWLGIGTGGGHL